MSEEALAASDFREFELEALEALVQFFRDREREDEAVVFERRLLDLAPVAAIGSAFSTRRLGTPESRARPATR